MVLSVSLITGEVNYGTHIVFLIGRIERKLLYFIVLFVEHHQVLFQSSMKVIIGVIHQLLHRDFLNFCDQKITLDIINHDLELLFQVVLGELPVGENFLSHNRLKTR
ncbi:hypothetical protein DGG96_07315 [Legionella qingyii]|uniref:Uncharacterized protein n=1 Tax=Legionella qingyii TaxID=2184757 RepID=A0A317U4V0_9GAMM|nr:hypothetical protein DGG96_07315 [Legionella qingyii]